MSTHELGPGRRFKSQLGEWYEREQVAAEVARAVEAERAKWADRVEAAFREGFNAPATYNDKLDNDVDDEWAKAKAGLLGEGAR